MNAIECYDIIGAFDVIEHIYDDTTALLNMAKAIRPGGRIILTVPQHPWLWSMADQFSYHQRRYSRTEISRKLKDVGCEVTYATSFVSLLVPLMLIYRSLTPEHSYDPMSEFTISPFLNLILNTIMNIEIILVKAGVSFLVGGSLLVIARKI